jgi:hypothetical protein
MLPTRIGKDAMRSCAIYRARQASEAFSGAINRAATHAGVADLDY